MSSCSLRRASAQDRHGNGRRWPHTVLDRRRDALDGYVDTAVRQPQCLKATLGPGQPAHQRRISAVAPGPGSGCGKWDSAAMENFFSPLKTERNSRKVSRTREDARSDVFEGIERFCNPAQALLARLTQPGSVCERLEGASKRAGESWEDQHGACCFQIGQCKWRDGMRYRLLCTSF
jgi:hypothetical protein